MADEALLAGGVAVAISLVSLVYARSQAVAARRQAEQAARLGALESSRHMLERFTELRRRRFHLPAALDDIRTASPDVAKLMDDAGGPEVFVLYRDLMDVYQEVYFLRRNGMVSDEHWRIWAEVAMVGPPTMPDFARVYRYACEQGWLDSNFIAFYEHAFHEGKLPDPALQHKARIEPDRRAE